MAAEETINVPALAEPCPSPASPIIAPPSLADHANPVIHTLRIPAKCRRGASKATSPPVPPANVLDNSPKPTVIYDDLPSDAPHGWKFLTVGPDNKLYFNIGAPCNICMPSDKHAQIRRINLDGSGAEVVARGIRQIVGMDWHPTR